MQTASFRHVLQHPTSTLPSVVVRVQVIVVPTQPPLPAVIGSTLRRVLDAFREYRVGSNMFAGVDGYGHGDIGRETLDKVYARLFGAEAALVSESVLQLFGC